MHINLGIFWARRGSVLIWHRSIGVADRIQAFADGGLGCIGAATGTLAANESPNTHGRRYRAVARAYLIEDHANVAHWKIRPDRSAIRRKD
jgi:hypothetical protein